MSIAFEKKDYRVFIFDPDDDYEEDNEECAPVDEETDEDFFMFSHEILSTLKELAKEDAVFIFDKCTDDDMFRFLKSH